MSASFPIMSAEEMNAIDHEMGLYMAKTRPGPTEGGFELPADTSPADTSPLPSSSGPCWWAGTEWREDPDGDEWKFHKQTASTIFHKLLDRGEMYAKRETYFRKLLHLQVQMSYDPSVPPTEYQRGLRNEYDIQQEEADELEQNIKMYDNVISYLKESLVRFGVPHVKDPRIFGKYAYSYERFWADQAKSAMNRPPSPSWSL